MPEFNPGDKVLHIKEGQAKVIAFNSESQRYTIELNKSNGQSYTNGIILYCYTNDLRKMSKKRDEQRSLSEFK